MRLRLPAAASMVRTGYARIRTPLRVAAPLRVATLVLLATGAALPSSRASAEANCNRTTVGYVPLTDLGTGTYQGFDGGLYAGGSNLRPAGHDAAGRAIAAAIAPIDGAVVLISIGMSNATQEFSRFVPLAMQHPGRNPALRVVDCAQGGQSAPIVADPNSPYWTTVMSRLAAAGVTPAQVRVAWVKEAVAGPMLAFPADAQQLQGYLRSIAQNLTDKFPNMALAYFSSRIYAGYAGTPLNPEPYAYQSGFAVRWLVDAQIAGMDPGLEFDPAAGPVEAPWIAWGPYLWADGLVPRSDGLTWTCDDFSQQDGTHPALTGRDKVANMLLDFFTTDPTAVPWFMNSPTDATGTVTAARLAVWPNPIRDGCFVRADGERGATSIHDVAGRLVRSLPMAGSGAAVAWDRLDRNGQRVAPGVYFVSSSRAPASSIKVVVAK
jgi:hypothetical protein